MAHNTSRFLAGRRGFLWLGAGLAGGAALPAWAQQTGFPAPGRPIRIVIPAPPGGPADILGRALGNYLSAQLDGVPVIIDSKPGGASVPAALNVARSAPEGSPRFQCNK